jgi:hypothetical protein
MVLKVKQTDRKRIGIREMKWRRRKKEGKRKKYPVFPPFSYLNSSSDDKW